MFSRAITRRTRIGSGTEELDGAAKPFLETDGRLVAEHLACRAEVGPGGADVAGAVRGELLLDRLTEDAADRLRELVHRRGSAGRDVEGAAARAGCVRGAGGRVHHVR